MKIARRRRWPTVAAAGFALLLAPLVAAHAAAGADPAAVPAAVAAPAASPAAGRDPHQVAVAGYVGRTACAGCHAAETAAWTGSHHDLAMQPANRETVLGDFADATHTHFGVTSRFFRQGGAFMVRTESETGALKDYRIDYVFGVYPLQQYLIAFPGGRYQALGIAWDSRPKAQGGQRWFHLYPDERIPPGDVLHWTAINQNWNYMCADCHSTALKRNYDVATDRYATTWSEIDVSCETCHGPGAAHAASATAAAATPAGTPKPAILPPEPALRDRDGVGWAIEAPAVTAKRTQPPALRRAEVEACAPCHVRRAALGDWIGHGQPLLDTYRPALLTEGLYQADGQMQDEVYNYGSFLQSRMYEAGVTCSDCHDPHSLRQRASGNGVCAQCHEAGHFDSPKHHFHAAGGPGAACVACHAPTVTYMVVDPRHDHSFRIPRPDLTVSIGVPNACTGCHADKPAGWAAAQVAAWYGPDRRREPHVGEAFAAARAGAPGWRQRLVDIAGDGRQPAIVRATAVDMLGSGLDRRALPSVLAATGGTADPLMRLAAAGAVEALPPDERLRTLLPLAHDPLRAIRLEAARLLASQPLEALPPDERTTLAAAFAEYETAATAIADRPEGLVRRAEFRLERGQPLAAEADLRLVIQRYPDFVPAHANLADLYRATGRDGDGERVLTEGLARVPGDAALSHALGLLRVRQQRYGEAADLLVRAAQAAPANARYGFIAALALDRAGRAGDADAVLRRTAEQHPNDVDTLALAARRSLDAGRTDEARRRLDHLARLAPDHPELAALRSRLPSPPTQPR
jgi:Flp pilus assembly protein TadD